MTTKKIARSPDRSKAGEPPLATAGKKWTARVGNRNGQRIDWSRVRLVPLRSHGPVWLLLDGVWCLAVDAGMPPPWREVFVRRAFGALTAAGGAS